MPEEINRVLTDHVSTLLFCPTDAAVENLKKEGIENGVHRVGDVMADALLHNLGLAHTKSEIMYQLSLKKGEYALATVHRASNTDDKENMRLILSAFGKLSSRVVFPVHPRTRKMMLEWGISVSSNVTMIEPVGHFDMLTLQKNANCILTDSGGVQKEAYLVGVRCITLREETEWVETVNAGWNRVAGVDVKKIVDSFESWFPQTERLPLYGDGHAAEQICGILSSTLK
jgi:UDP-N-acetylglucosamine 2-epimerase